MTKRQIGMQINKLKRYKLILDLYNKHKTEDIPDAVILRNYIFPVYPISRTTFYTIQTTPVNKLLNELETMKNQKTTN